MMRCVMHRDSHWLLAVWRVVRRVPGERHRSDLTGTLLNTNSNYFTRSNCDYFTRRKGHYFTRSIGHCFTRSNCDYLTRKNGDYFTRSNCDYFTTADITHILWLSTYPFDSSIYRDGYVLIASGLVHWSGTRGRTELLFHWLLETVVCHLGIQQIKYVSLVWIYHRIAHRPRNYIQTRTFTCKQWGVTWN